VFQKSLEMSLFNEPFEICPGMSLLASFAETTQTLAAIESVLAVSPLRQMQTARGFYMSVKTSSCGEWGWISDRKGYRYVNTDPITENPWPAMPKFLFDLARKAAEQAGYSDFYPDTCLINHYVPGVQMGAHQDKDELDFSQPIVSVSIGIPARFFVVGPERAGKSRAVDLKDGDVIVFGGPARRFYHGVRKLKEATHPTFGAQRWNLTFRKAR